VPFLYIIICRKSGTTFDLRRALISRRYPGRTPVRLSLLARIVPLAKRRKDIQQKWHCVQPLDHWDAGTCIWNSQDQYTIAHVPAWSALALRAARAPLSRKLVDFYCVASQWKKTDASAGPRHFPGRTTPFPGESPSSLTFTSFSVFRLLFDKRTL